MALLPEIINTMAAAGCTAEQIAAVVKTFSDNQEAAERARMAEEQARRAEKAAKNADRQRRHRERNAPSRDVTQTERYERAVTVTSPPSLSPLPSPGPQPTPLNPPTPDFRSVDAAFDRFWQAYPRRDGANPRKVAAEKFRLAVRDGASAETLIASADAYRRECDRLGLTRTPSVAQCQTWFNQRRWEDYAIPDPPAEPEREYPAAAAMLADPEADIAELVRIRETDGWDAADLFAQQHHRRTA